jgi:glycosyltransferase involved in cell wall biosynthesis
MITFVIPSINRETLKRSIDSLMKQSSHNWRAIIIYDGVDGETKYGPDKYL